jgi:hypothetical protein
MSGGAGVGAMDALMEAGRWERTRGRFTAWWRRQGMLLRVTAPREAPAGAAPEPAEPTDPVTAWTDPSYRLAREESQIARTYYGADAFPCFDPEIGPGNLATFLGSPPRYDRDTVWFDPCIEDPEGHPRLLLDPDGVHYRRQMAIIDAAVAASAGRYRVGLPDLVENIDVLVSLRGMERLLEDMMDRPAFVMARCEQVNRAWFDAYGRIFNRVADAWGGSAWACFKIWGEGRTAKLQCDASATFSPAMFRRFVVPGLREQCRWLNHSLYHLDGLQCVVHLDELLALDDLDAIQWTAGAGRPGGGDPSWYELYRRILGAGKCVMATEVRPQEVIPLLDAVGPRGLYIVTRAGNEEQARDLEERAQRYR